MEFRLIHVLGPVVATVAMYFIGRNMVQKEKGREIRVAPTLILFFSALAFHIFFTEGTFLDRVSIILLDFGIAMIIDSGYLAYHKVHPKVFWGLGMILVFTAAIMYLLSYLFGIIWRFDSEVSNSRNEVLVELGTDDRIDEISGILANYDATWEAAYPMVTASEDSDLSQTFLISVKDGKATDLVNELLNDKENVDFAEENFDIGIEPIESESETNSSGIFFANDPQITGQWWMVPEEINAIHEILKDLRPAKKAKVAIVDTGVDSKHEDISGVFRISPGSTDVHGHGTHCAGLSGASTNNGKGIASLNWEGKFIEVKGYHALDTKGRGTTETVAEAIIRAAEDDADVINLSLGGMSPFPPRSQVKAIEYAQSLGCIVIAAAGNNNGNARNHSPSNIEGVISVAAVNPSGRKAEFSNINTGLARPIAAPGVDILSLKTGGGYVRMSGTSMATPIVSGLVGMMRAINPDLSAGDAYRILNESGKPVEDSDKVGKVINCLAAIELLMESGK